MITIRRMSNEDLPRCIEISDPLPARAVRLEEEFCMYSTLVADLDGVLVGYTQFVLGPDNILHSLALRVAPEGKGQGVGSALMAEKARLARVCGATMHMYAVVRDGEPALKKILLKQGMHLCRDGAVQLYVEHFDATA